MRSVDLYDGRVMGQTTYKLHVHVHSCPTLKTNQSHLHVSLRIFIQLPSSEETQYVCLTAHLLQEENSERIQFEGAPEEPQLAFMLPVTLLGTIYLVSN